MKNAHVAVLDIIEINMEFSIVMYISNSLRNIPCCIFFSNIAFPRVLVTACTSIFPPRPPNEKCTCCCSRYPSPRDTIPDPYNLQHTTLGTSSLWLQIGTLYASKMYLDIYTCRHWYILMILSRWKQNTLSEPCGRTWRPWPQFRDRYPTMTTSVNKYHHK